MKTTAIVISIIATVAVTVAVTLVAMASRDHAVVQAEPPVTSTSTGQVWGPARTAAEVDSWWRTSFNAFCDDGEGEAFNVFSRSVEKNQAHAAFDREDFGAAFEARCASMTPATAPTTTTTTSAPPATTTTEPVPGVHLEDLESFARRSASAAWGDDPSYLSAHATCSQDGHDISFAYIGAEVYCAVEGWPWLEMIVRVGYGESGDVAMYVDVGPWAMESGGSDGESTDRPSDGCPAGPPAAQRVYFERASEGIVLDRGDLSTYPAALLLGVGGGQQINVTTDGWGPVCLYAPGGWLLAAADDGNLISNPLPSTGDYVLVVYGDPSTISIFIPAP